MPLSLSQFLETLPANVPADLKALVLDMAAACRDIGQTVNNSAITGKQGALAQENVQGEVQKELDVIANDMMLEPERWHGRVAAVASEEMDTLHPIADGGEYLLVFDPIDGSSNLDVNGVVGTIFSILDAPKGRAVTEADFLIPGHQQVAAGYTAYGPQTTMMLTLGAGTFAFSIDHDRGEWVLIRDTVAIPESTREFAINMSNHRHWEAPVRRYIDECVAGKDGPRGVDFNMRWLASMVGDVHRILTRGGVFIYPVDQRASGKAGKLRLLYECNPISMLIEQAGGAATDGHQRILDIAPTALHQRTGIVLGSKEEVTRVTQYHG